MLKKAAFLIGVILVGMGVVHAGNQVLSDNSGDGNAPWHISCKSSVVINGFDFNSLGIQRPAVIDKVSISVQSPVSGTPATVVVYEDANGGSPVTFPTTRTADATRERLTAALTQHGFADVAAARAALLPADELAGMTAQLRAIDTQRDQAEALLAQPEVSAAEQQPAPDLEALARAAATARDEATRARRAQTIAESAEHRLHDLAGEVHAILERIGPAEAEQAVVQELADCVAGTSGNNTLRMRLSSYLLAARLEEVARLANERLQVMTEGRYTLVYSDALARRGARSGLGLRVVDAWTGASRETSTLSGGESFMASLALALGLGDAVRAEAGGFDLQTLFVDEGFGTLDDDSLEQVMGVLDSLREGGRSVGIVSHVSELRQRIPAQLRVSKSQSGSSIEVVSGVPEVA